MSLEFILLGQLDEPASGYDLHQRMERGVKYFWPAELSQIYPTLRRLEASGLLACSEQDSLHGPKRQVYKRTKKGDTALRDWLEGPPAVGSERFAYLGQLFFLGALGDVSLVEDFFRSLRGVFVRQLAAIAELEQTLVAQGAKQAAQSTKAGTRSNARTPSLAQLCKHLTLRMGVHTLRAKIDWCDEALRELGRMRKKGERS